MDRSTTIFGNKMSPKTIKKATKSKQKFLNKFGDDSKQIYHLGVEPNQTLAHLHLQNLVSADQPYQFNEKDVIVGNIRMGFGHYRIAIAIASCLASKGYNPLWFDLNSFQNTSGGKLVKHLNSLYSFGSRLSQKSKLFNHLVWEPMNSETFRQISYNAIDQKNAEIFIPMYHDFPSDIPFIGTHVWPTQGAVHKGMKNVINIIPDNWPMGLHLAEGSLHTVQTPFAYLGYKTLRGMSKTKLNEMPEGSIEEVGYYIDHELVSNLEGDTSKRLSRIVKKDPLRILLPVGGAGAGVPVFIEMIQYLLPYIKERKVQLFINFGDHLNVYEIIKKKIHEFDSLSKKVFNQFDQIEDFIKQIDALDQNIVCFYHKDIFEAVYSTNLLMRHMDLLATKPSELAYYPIPKLMIKRVGGHEQYGAIHASEMGDGTFECETNKEMISMLDSLIHEKDILYHMNQNILRNHHMKRYDGGYRVVELMEQNRK